MLIWQATIWKIGEARNGVIVDAIKANAWRWFLAKKNGGVCGVGCGSCMHF